MDIKHQKNYMQMSNLLRFGNHIQFNDAMYNCLILNLLKFYIYIQFIH